MRFNLFFFFSNIWLNFLMRWFWFRSLVATKERNAGRKEASPMRPRFELRTKVDVIRTIIIFGEKTCTVNANLFVLADHQVKMMPPRTTRGSRRHGSAQVGEATDNEAMLCFVFWPCFSREGTFQLASHCKLYRFDSLFFGFFLFSSLWLLENGRNPCTCSLDYTLKCFCMFPSFSRDQTAIFRQCKIFKYKIRWTGIKS